MAVGDVPVLMGHEEIGELGADPLHQDRVVVDDRAAQLIGNERDVAERVGRDFTDIHQALSGAECAAPEGVQREDGGQQHP